MSKSALKKKVGEFDTDKGRLLLNQPTSITGKVQSIDDLAKAFNLIANENVVSVQDKSDEEK